MNKVAETGEIIVVTKNGQPVAQLGLVVSHATTLAGAHKGQIAIRGDIVAPVDAAWESAGPDRHPHADLVGPAGEDTIRWHDYK